MIVVNNMEKFVILQLRGIIVIKSKDTRVVTNTCRYSSYPNFISNTCIIGIEYQLGLL